MTTPFSRRYRLLNEGTPGPGEVVYWMSRDQRTADNWALAYAQHVAQKRNVPLTVFFGLSPAFLDATMRHYDFMLKGLKELESSLNKLNIRFALRTGNPSEELISFVREKNASAVIADFSPLRTPRLWREAVAKSLTIPFIEVDAHNIVPCWLASPKLEYAAYTFRPKIKKLLEQFLIPIPKVVKHPFGELEPSHVDWSQVKQTLKVNTLCQPIDWLVPGERAAHQAFEGFRSLRLYKYAKDRNDPNEDAQSNLSPYLHFGHISAQKIAFEISKLPQNESTESFLEELIVRRELSDNFCYYQKNYDSIDCFATWAKDSLNAHLSDPREYIYSLEEFELAKTHDPLWNAAQKEMLLRGKMHGYMRMYWAKKILEWSESPAIALKTAIKLNDTYQLDGRDPNGYAGIAWSIGGVHDRPWFERPIFGKIRFMSFNGCKSKFDIKAYIKRFE